MQLTYEQFRQVALSDDPERLLALPKHAMPDDIPKSLLNEISYAHRPMMENLIFEVSSYRLNLLVRLTKDLGQGVHDAVTLSRQPLESEEYVDFKNISSQFALLYIRAKKEQKILTTEKLRAEFEKTKGSLNELKRTLTDMLLGRQVLNSVYSEVCEEYQYLIKKSMTDLSNKANAVGKVISAYFFMCLSLSNAQMAKKRNQVDESEAQATALHEAILEKRENLQDLCSNYLKKKLNTAEIDKLKSDILAIEDQVQSLNIVIDEDDLLLWLDILVEASLIAKTADESADRSIQSAQIVLFYLLNKYCVLQELGAEKVAHNPFLMANPDKVIQYLLGSEAFILKYFATKREEVKSWFGSSADAKIHDLSVLEGKLLSKMKKNAKKLG